MSRVGLDGRVKSVQYLGDWPAGMDSGSLIGRNGGVGPQMTDTVCEACSKLIAASGECGCS